MIKYKWYVKTYLNIYRPQGKVMFSRGFVCPDGGGGSISLVPGYFQVTGPMYFFWGGGAGYLRSQVPS